MKHRLKICSNSVQLKKRAWRQKGSKVFLIIDNVPYHSMANLKQSCYHQMSPSLLQPQWCSLLSK